MIPAITKDSCKHHIRAPGTGQGAEGRSVSGALRPRGPDAGQAGAQQIGGVRAPIRVLLVDDEEMSRRGCEAVLAEASGMAVVGYAGVGIGALAAITENKPDVVLVNTSTERDWTAVVQQMMLLPPPAMPRVMVLLDDVTEERLVAAVRTGAAGVLLRSLSVSELIYAVHHVAAGHSVLSPAATTWLLERLRSLVGSPHGGDNNRLAGLSRREVQVLAGLAVGKSNLEIASDINLTVATVKSHVSHILTKLGVRDRVQAALLGQRARLGEDTANGVPGTASPET
jgi:DNA-binding NarL/FixJ family response regulator